MGISTGTLALKELNMTTEDFEGLNAEESFLKMADAIRDIDDPMQKAAAANKLFGRSGKELLNVLDLGADAIRNYVKEAAELGGPISREDIKQVEAANDAFDKMGRAVEGVAQQVAIALAPSLTDILNLMKDLLSFSGKFKTVWSEIQDFMTTTVIVFTAELEGAAAVWDNMFNGKGFEDLEKKLDEIDKRRDAALDTVIGVGPDGPDGKSKGGGGAAIGAALGVTKGFANSIGAQSSKAFDTLNPGGVNSVAGKQLKVQERIEKNTEKTAEAIADGAVKFVQVEIGS
jgi:hypothetical protein